MYRFGKMGYQPTVSFLTPVFSGFPIAEAASWSRPIASDGGYCRGEPLDLRRQSDLASADALIGCRLYRITARIMLEPMLVLMMLGFSVGALPTGLGVSLFIGT